MSFPIRSSSSTRSIGNFNKIGEAPTQYTCAFLNVPELIKVSEVCSFFHKTISSLYIFKEKAKHQGIILSKDQIPKNVNILNLQTIREDVFISHKIAVLQQIADYHNAVIHAMAIPMLPIPPEPAPLEHPSKNVDSLFKAYAALLAQKNNSA